MISVPEAPQGFNQTKTGIFFPSEESAGAGAAADNPVVWSQEQYGSGTSSTTFTIPSELSDDDLVLIFSVKQDDIGDNGTDPSGFTEGGYFESFGGADRAIRWSYKLIADAATEKALTTWTTTFSQSGVNVDSMAFICRGFHNLTTPIDSSVRRGESNIGGVTITTGGQWTLNWAGYVLDASGAECVPAPSTEGAAQGEDFYLSGRTIPDNQTGQCTGICEWWYEESSGTSDLRTSGTASVAGTSGDTWSVSLAPV